MTFEVHKTIMVLSYFLFQCMCSTSIGHGTCIIHGLSYIDPFLPPTRVGRAPLAVNY